MQQTRGRPAQPVLQRRPTRARPRAAATSASASSGSRVGTVERQTRETRVSVSINLDGTGVCSSQSGIPFLDHMVDVRRA
jgi:imidazoleglycerol-phosphate dehydratase